MINEVPQIMTVNIPSEGGLIEVLLTGDQQVETLKIKLNEVIRHIKVLEEKLLSPGEEYSNGAERPVQKNSLKK